MARDAAHPGGIAEGRVPWVDTAKGLCIVLVVMMHATLGVGEAMGGEGFMHWVVAFARPFRMPDFFLVSGLFLSRVIDRDWRAYSDRRVVHFLYFYLLWLLIQSALKFGQVSGGTSWGFAHHLALSLVEPFGTLWFVYLLAVLSVVTKLLRGVPPVLLLSVAAALQVAPVHTGWTLVDEFCARWVYFLAGYLFAPAIFRLAEAAVARRGLALAGLAAWALVNGSLALSPSPVAGYPTLASLPLVSLALGAAGAVAVVTIAALLTQTPAAAPFRYCGRHSIAIYLAFFLPMAATRAALLKSGVIADVGVVSAIVTAVAVVAPLVLERIVRGTPLSFLFKRPAAFHIAPARAPRLQPAE
ncbi:MAG TPA: acyltransferase family protein [Beijerinckiaceae bacterium]|jgi:uncharacterized membrane protein YcfT